MRKKSEVGQIGEDIACAYLKDKGWRILARNVKKPWGELDIVGIDRGKVLVFVEVKTLQDRGESFTPEDNYNYDKGRKTKRTAQLYAGKHQKLLSEKHGWRIDLVTITICDPLLTDWRKDCVIKHYENV